MCCSLSLPVELFLCWNYQWTCVAPEYTLSSLCNFHLFSLLLRFEKTKSLFFNFPHFLVRDSVKEHIKFVSAQLFWYVSAAIRLPAAESFHQSKFPSELPAVAWYPITTFKSIMIKCERLIRKPGTLIPLFWRSCLYRPICCILSWMIVFQSTLGVSPLRAPPAVRVKGNTTLFSVR